LEISFLEEHRAWTLKICRELGLEAISPLYGKDGKKLLKEFLDAGFKAIIIYAKASAYPEKIIGKSLDWDTIKLLEEGGIDPCGEYGEYHTLVLDGPIFKMRIEIVKAKIIDLPPDHLALEIDSWRLVRRS